MGNESICPGCKAKFINGRPYSVHIRLCKNIDLAANTALKKHKIVSAKKIEEKKAAIAARRESAAQAGQPLLDGQEGDLDLDMQEDVLPQIQPPIRSPSPPPRPSGRPSRRIRMPKRYRDDLPINPNPPIISVPVTEPEEDNNVLDDNASERPDSEHLSTSEYDSTYCTEENSFGIYRKYSLGPPTITPDDSFTLSSISDSVSIARDPADSRSKASWWSSFGSSCLTTLENATDNYFTPFLNASVFLLMAWYYNGSSIKSYADIDKLIHDVVRHEDFRASDFGETFSTAREAERMDKHQASKSSASSDNCEDLPFKPGDGWISGCVSIPLPCDGFRFNSEEDAPRFVVNQIWYRRPLEVIKKAFTEPAAEKFHISPFNEYWKPSQDGPEERLYSETYTADLFNDEYETLLATPREGPNSKLEPFVAGIVFYSDSTHLTSFGTASLWPIYMYIGNQSQYIRGKPSEFAAHHIAYIPKLGDEIHDFYREKFGKVPSAAMLTHLRRELAHAIWRLMLDDDLMRAYTDGEPIKLFDEIMRALFPRFLFYSADYPEKILISCIKFLAKCMCPRCLSVKSKISQVGSKTDMRNRVKLARIDNDARRFDIEVVRKMLFEKGINITSVKIDRILGPTSGVPTRNAFSEFAEHLGVFKFNFHQLLVPDLLHEFELGIWKAIFTHLLRILHAYGHDAIYYLNSRFRQISPFGRDTIRKFTNNVSGMKKLAARDFEDLLQCSIPAFEGILPKKHDRVIQKLIFELATWHGLAKLRLHTDSTLLDLENSATRLGDILRKFKVEVCGEYATRDLPSEEAARGRRQAAKALKVAEKQKSQAAGGPQALAPVAKPGPSKFRTFNMETYKLHGLPDVPAAIRAFGVTENTSTLNGESEHKRSKQFYPRVRKGDHVRGIARHVYRERTLFQVRQAMRKRKLEQKLHDSEGSEDANLNTLNIPIGEEEALGPTLPEHHHHISKDIRHKVNVHKWLADNRKDPALKNFLPHLKDHLLSRLLLNSEEDVNEDHGSFTNMDRLSLNVVNNRIYRHNVLRVNYTTYNVRRSQDSLNPRTNSDIMMLSRDDDDAHPYWYARIIGIFHAMVMHTGPKSKLREPKKMEFLFVRWFGLDTEGSERGGWKAKKLHQIGFIEGDTAFGFVDPSDVIRAIHLIPRFSQGRTKSLLGHSFARSALEKDEDWVRYYVNMFVDRDMIMRFRGGGVGHTSTRAATDFFKKDLDILDMESRRAQQERYAPLDLEDEEGNEDTGNDLEMDVEGSEAGDVDEDELSETELVDYGYEQEGDSNSDEDGEEEEDWYVGEEEAATVDGLGALGYAEY